jgi:hypothetical protein
MRSLTIVERDIFIKNPLNLTLASQQKIVQRLSSHCPEKPFHDAVHVRRFHPRSDRYEIVGQILDIEHQSIVMNQIGSARNGFTEKHQLLPDKFPGRIFSDGRLNNLACLV